MRTSALIVFIVAVLIPAASYGQSISIASVYRNNYAEIISEDPTYINSISEHTNASLGSFQASDTISVPLNLWEYYPASAFAAQASDIRLSSTFVSVSGRANGAVSFNNVNASYIAFSELSVGFSVISPCYYTLVVSVSQTRPEIGPYLTAGGSYVVLQAAYGLIQFHGNGDDTGRIFGPPLATTLAFSDQAVMDLPPLLT